MGIEVTLVCWGHTMKLVRRQFMRLAAGAAALPAASRIASAQSYPSRPITLIVPFPAGGAADAIARIIVERMRRPLGQRIVINPSISNCTFFLTLAIGHDSSAA